MLFRIFKKLRQRYNHVTKEELVVSYLLFIIFEKTRTDIGLFIKE